MNAKTFKIKTNDGTMRECEQLATFAAYVQNIQFRFVVIKDGFDVSLTHRNSGSRVARIDNGQIMAARGDYELAGRSALKSVIDRAGEARVRSVLSAAE